MNKIVSPLKQGMKGQEVADLQAALRLLLERSVLLAKDEVARQKLLRAVEKEHVNQSYGETTRRLVGIFQNEHGLKTLGEVDEPTANAINALLVRLGALAQKRPVGSGTAITRAGLKLDELVGILPLEHSVVQKLKEKNLVLDEVGEATFASMVSDKIISPKQKQDIQLAIGLAKLSGENIELTKALKNAIQESPVELVRWNKADWLQFLQEKKIKLPAEETDLDSYAENLRDVVEQSFPSEYFLYRLVNGDAPKKTSGLVSTIAPIFKSNATIIPADSSQQLDYDWNGISEGNRKNIQSGLAELIPLVNTYRHLGLADIINQRDMNVAQKQSEINKRFASLSTFNSNNPGINLQYADFATSNSETKKDDWNWQGIDAADQPYVKKQMAATQRVFILAGSQEACDLLMKQGFDSAYAITSMTENDFVDRSGLGWEKGKAAYARANEVAVASSNFYESIRDVQRGGFRDIGVNNQDPSLVNDLKEIDGYEELFGKQDYCDCEHCKSILGPAAYFTDLMYFVQENISNKAFPPSNDKHQLYLKRRRPDLWTLKLSCQNTNTEIPYLQVVIEVLEKYLAQAIPSADVYGELRTANYSCRHPFNLALEETRLYLSHFDLSLADIYKTLKLPKEEQQREQLLLSIEELGIVSTWKPEDAKKRFGDTSLDNFDVQDFIRLAGISRTELDDLRATKFDQRMAQIIVDQEVLTGLNGDILDVIHRYLRLWKKTNWTLREFDLVLYAMNTKGLLKKLEDHEDLDGDGLPEYPKLLQLAQVCSIQKRLGCSPEEMAAIVDHLPLIAVAANQRPLYGRIFDLERIFGDANANENTTISVPASVPKVITIDTITPLILAGLGISEPELIILFELLEIKASERLTVDIKLLSDLYRQARIARGLRLSIEDFVHLVNLVIGREAVTQLTQIEALAEAAAWQKTSPFSISELRLILEGKESYDLQFENNIRVSSKAVIDIQSDKSVETSEKLSALPSDVIFPEELKGKICYDASQQILIFKGVMSTTERDALKLSTDTSYLTAVDALFNGTQIKKDLMIDLLKAFLQRSFNLTQDQLGKEFIQNLVLCDLSSDDITRALNAQFIEGEPRNLPDLNRLVKLLQDFERYTLLFTKAQLDAEMISFLVANPAVFGIIDFQSLTFAQLVNIVRYHALIENKAEQRTVLNSALRNIQSNNGTFTDTENVALANAWSQPESLIASLPGQLITSGPAIEIVDYLQDCLGCCITLGVQGDALDKLKKSDAVGLLAARNIVVGAFASKYPDEITRNEKLEPYNDKINTLKRDALCDYIISRSGTLKFKDRNDLYNFFLLDVEMNGCFRTSKLVAAISSLQLYVHRCLMNLEQSSSHNTGNILPKEFPVDEWEWRKNYRVWEANRKVFLYPENYIVPTLRDNKTEIFKELEDELLQQKITKDSAEAAYKKYLSKFSELTRLRYAGGYYHRISNADGFLRLNTASALDGGPIAFYYVNFIALDTESDESCFYLFARTNTQPYQYYYRTYNHYKKVWTSWKTIELGIDATEISTLIYQGKLYIYWTEVQNKEVNAVKEGGMTSDGFMFKAYVKYSFLDENGKWSAPQRLYIGQTHMDEETIFKRAWSGDYPGNEKTREKMRDSTVEKFQELVFLKPYAIIQDDITQPIALQHIWTHKKTRGKVEYTTTALSRKVGDTQFNCPSHTFVVVNDQFEQLDEISATITKDGRKNSAVASLFLLNAMNCYAIFTDYSLAFPVRVIAKHNLDDSPIQTTITNISLSRNAVTNLSDDDMLADAVDISTVPSMQFVANSESRENGYIGFLVENGKLSLSKHYVGQTPESDAQLAVNKQDYVTIEQVVEMRDSVRLSTILTDELSDILFANGLEQFLSLTTQRLTNDGEQLDFDGSYGEYYWEMFFHAPFIIADHLNANQKFKEAKWWYERIFNPTAEELPEDVNKTDRNWQFREFLDLGIQKMKDILTDGQAIDTYKKDPFNPHAIARLRLSAYQKTIVMHYIDNLLDWGDYLFIQDARESINEAEMLYQLAFDILGRRPVKLGKCKTEDEDALTYERIGPQIDKGSEFLIQLENYYWVQKQTHAYEKELARNSKMLEAMVGKKGGGQKSFAEIERKLAYTSAHATITQIREQASKSDTPRTETDPYAASVKSYKNTTAMKREVRENLNQWKDAEEYLVGREADKNFKTRPNRRLPGHDLVKQYSMVFCVPQNSELMQYWDRVEDRLFKIRNCLNIKGIRRNLALFQPPIDPMLLVRARAAGLSLEDIAALGSGSNTLPIYRFTYLIEKAKQFTQTVQAFGSALLSALEKKDGEELMLLRTVHEKNIQKLTKVIKKKQLLEAQNQYKAAETALTNVQNRIDYYQGLIETGLIPSEIVEQVSKMYASEIRISEATVEFLASTFGYQPQVGSAFAMKYGGLELSSGTEKQANGMGTLAVIADNIAILAAIEASHQRREQDWKQQLKLSQQEYKQSTLQLLAADIRQQIAEQDLAIHEKNMEQSDEIYDFYKNKFTGLGLYNFMASTMNRLYRNAYNIANDLAKQAESAYRFERFDDEMFIQGDNWQFDRAGMLAGERLMLQLQELEKKYIEGNERQPEITQTFSLAMLSPLQLLELRQNGSCMISIPEIAFEVLYPGQYRRVIKSVRLTIPCVAGPYTNISARLTLQNGKIRPKDSAFSLNESDLEERGTKNTIISASSANNDAGVFDFNFRDERYMPFEGAGAVSDWLLELPKDIRAFNYDTISDVLLHISYTACEGGNRQAAEGAISDLVNKYSAEFGFYRLISLRYEFPETLYKLFSEDNQVAIFELTRAHFPYLLSSKDLTMVTGCKVYVKPKKKMKAKISGTVTINDKDVNWNNSENIPSGTAEKPVDEIKGGTVALNGSPVKTWTIVAGNGGIEKDSTEDVLILLAYKALSKDGD